MYPERKTSSSNEEEADANFSEHTSAAVAAQSSEWIDDNRQTHEEGEEEQIISVHDRATHHLETDENFQELVEEVAQKRVNEILQQHSQNEKKKSDDEWNKNLALAMIQSRQQYDIDVQASKRAEQLGAEPLITPEVTTRQLCPPRLLALLPADMRSERTGTMPAMSSHQQATMTPSEAAILAHYYANNGTSGMYNTAPASAVSSVPSPVPSVGSGSGSGPSSLPPQSYVGFDSQLSEQWRQSKLVEPHLNGETPKDVTDFLDKVHHYIQQKGQLLVRQLLSGYQLDNWTYLANASENTAYTAANIPDEALVKAMYRFIRPVDAIAFKEKAATNTMPGTLDNPSHNYSFYYLRFNRQIEAYGDMASCLRILKMTEEDFCRIFVNGLAPYLKKEMLYKKLKTFGVLYKAAYDSVEETTRSLIQLRGIGMNINYAPVNEPRGHSAVQHSGSGSGSGSGNAGPQKRENNSAASYPAKRNRAADGSAGHSGSGPSGTGRPPLTPRPGQTCDNCGKSDHLLDTCPLVHNDARIKAAKAERAAKANRNPPPSKGMRHVKCYRVCVSEDVFSNQTKSGIAQCNAAVTSTSDVSFQHAHNIKISLDTCAEDTLVSLSLFRKMNMPLPAPTLLEIEGWDGKKVIKTAYKILLCLKLTNENSSKPYVFQIKCFALDMIQDMIMSRDDMDTFCVTQYLSAETLPFPYSTSWEQCPEEEDEEQYGPGIDFSSTSTAIDADTFAYQISDDFTKPRELKSLLIKYHKVFVPSRSAIKADPFYIQTIAGSDIPRQWPRNVPPATQAEIDKEVDRWLAEGICRESRSSVAFPVVTVRKPDGSMRLCVDYQGLNKWTVNIAHPLPRVMDQLKALKGKHFYAKVDLRWGFHQLEVREDSKHLTAFCTKKGLFEFNRLPFGLKNASSFFQMTVSNILRDIPQAQVFIDDIIIGADTEEEFLLVLEQVLKRLTERGVVLKAKKCIFGAKVIEYLGYLVDAHSMRLSERRVEAVTQYPKPKDAKSIKRFLGMASAFRETIKDYCIITIPLVELTKKGQPFIWADKQQEAFDILRESIAKRTKLFHISYEHPIILRTDASIEGVGAVLLQIVDGVEQIILYMSLRLSEIARRWSTIEQEAFAIFWEIMKLESYLLGHLFYLQTDHQNLLHMANSLTPKVVRWRLRLQEFDFQIVHIPGKTNIAADALSRCFIVTTRQLTGDELALETGFLACHNDVVGHHGVQRTKTLLRRQANSQWAALSNKKFVKQIQTFIDTCVTCQKHRVEQGENTPALGSTMRFEPFECIAFDTMGPFPEDQYGNKYIIVGIDMFTRTVELTARKDATAKSAAMSILEMVGRYGVPRMIQSDQGTQYVNDTIDALLEFFPSERRLTLPYRPQANGMVERSNQEVLKHLRAIVFDRRIKTEWSTVLPLVQRIMNSQIHSATGTSPLRLLYGDAITANRGLLTGWSDHGGDYNSGATVDMSEYLADLNQKLSDIVSASQLYQQKVVSKRLAKSPASPTTFDIGDYVLVSYPHGVTPDKLTPFWKGPLLVSKVENQTYWCQDLLSGRENPFFVDRLKLFTPAQHISNEDVAVADTDQFIVERIITHRGDTSKRSTLEFKVKWQGYPIANDNTDWIPWSVAMKNVLLKPYLRSIPSLCYIIEKKCKRGKRAGK